MKIVYLTAGPRGSGKSTWVSLVKRTNPEIIVIDRDEFLTKKFGGTSFDKYSGVHEAAHYLLKEHIEKVVSLADDNARIILDFWNGHESERARHIKMLRKLGVERVVCLYFITPLPVCLRWFKNKPDMTAYSEENCIWDYNLFHKKANDLKYPDYSQNDFPQFNLVYQVNPQQLMLPGIAIIS